MMKNSFKVLLVVCIFMLPTSLHAIKMDSQRYSLESEDVDFTTTTPQTVLNGFPLSPSDQKQFNTEGYVLHTNNSDTFSVSADKQNLSFGTMVPEIPITASVSINVRPAFGYQVSLSQSSPFMSFSGSTIQATNCDNGCTIHQAGRWTHESAAGFGYTVDGNDTSNDFKTSYEYRSLSSGTDEPIIISSPLSRASEAELTFRLISKSTENYTSEITVLTLPTY